MNAAREDRRLQTGGKPADLLRKVFRIRVLLYWELRIMSRQFINDVDGKFKLPLKDDDEKTVAYLLWGDHVQTGETSGQWVKVKARGEEGWVPKSALTDEGLLEVYVIDVGQGDGVLVRTPDDAWQLVDAGVANEKQMTKKGAANFIRWEFLTDLGKDAVSLTNVIVSHPDFDHYGGMLDLLAGKVMRPDRTFRVKVENFYHCGIGRFASAPKLQNAQWLRRGVALR